MMRSFGMRYGNSLSHGKQCLRGSQSIRWQSHSVAAPGALVVAISLPAATKLSALKSVVSAEEPGIPPATGNRLRRAQSHTYSQDLPASPLCDDPRCYWRPGRRRQVRSSCLTASGSFGKLQIHGRLLPKIVIPVIIGTRRAVVEHSGRRDLDCKQQGSNRGRPRRFARPDQLTNATRSCRFRCSSGLCRKLEHCL
jgi:hypothetical protein